MSSFMESWLMIFADMESFTDSYDDLSQLIRETAETPDNGELSESDLSAVAAARKVPPLRRKPDSK